MTAHANGTIILSQNGQMFPLADETLARIITLDPLAIEPVEPRQRCVSVPHFL